MNTEARCEHRSLAVEVGSPVEPISSAGRRMTLGRIGLGRLLRVTLVLPVIALGACTPVEGGEPPSRPPIVGVRLHTLPARPSPEASASPARHSAITGALDLVAVIFPHDVWAIGADTFGPPHALHWDGARWTEAPAPRKGKFGDAQINAIAGASSDDVWAVGSTGSSASEALIEHWDGTAWSISRGPTIGYATSLLNDVAVLPSGEAWAVGWAGHEALTERWDGRAWRIVPAAPSDRHVALLGVTAISSDDVWAVGRSGARPIAEHWDGSRWSVTPFPQLEGVSSFDLSSVTAVSSTEVWAAGLAFTKATLTRRSVNLVVVARWDGRRWSSIVERRVPFAFGATVEGSSAHDLWLLTTGLDAGRTVDHWDGTAWHKLRFPKTGGGPSSFGLGEISDLALVDGGDAWAVGSRWTRADQTPLIERWDGRTWSVVVLAPQETSMEAGGRG